MQKQMKVSDFYRKFVPNEFKNNWFSLMKEWDGSKDVYNAFYNIDVLIMKLAEAKEEK